jgi:hypothetical protein
VVVVRERQLEVEPVVEASAVAVVAAVAASAEPSFVIAELLVFAEGLASSGYAFEHPGVVAVVSAAEVLAVEACSVELACS